MDNILLNNEPDITIDDYLNKSNINNDDDLNKISYDDNITFINIVMED